MTKQRAKSPRLRLFVALELPEAVRSALAAWQSALVDAGGGELRAGGPETLHITLAFIGYRPAKDADRLTEALSSVEPRIVPLAFAETAIAKPPKRPRFYAAQAEPDEALLALRHELVAALTERAGFTDEQRAFWPHVTLARVKSRVKHHAALEPVPSRPAALRTPAAASAITLFKSDLLPSGAVYTPLATVALPGEPV